MLHIYIEIVGKIKMAQLHLTELSNGQSTMLVACLSTQTAHYNITANCFGQKTMFGLICYTNMRKEILKYDNMCKLTFMAKKILYRCFFLKNETFQYI